MLLWTEYEREAKRGEEIDVSGGQDRSGVVR